MYNPRKYEKFLSFFREIMLETVASESGQDLEVLLSNGKLRLDANHSNYSFGSLHRAFARCFKKLDFDKRNFSNVLILGFGAGSVASILRNDYNSKAHITGIESDKKVLELYNDYFRVGADDNLDIIHEDAVSFLESNKITFDLVIFDIYIDRDVPGVFEKPAILEMMKSALDEEKGMLVFNKYVYDAKSTGSANLLLNNFRKIFTNTSTISIKEMYTNLMLIAETS